MKRLLTTAMVLMMLATMFCASPVVTAAGNPGMDIKLVYKENTADTISAVLTDVEDATWVVWSIKANSTGEYVYIEEKRGNKAESEGFVLTVDMAEKSALISERNFTAEANITYGNGTTVSLTKPIEYKGFAEIQSIIRGMLRDTNAPQEYSVTSATDLLSIPRPSYYDVAQDNAIVETLRNVYVAELGNSSLAIDPEQFSNEVTSAMLVAALNSGNSATIKTVIESYYTDLGIAINTTEKIWYDASATKNNVTATLATFTYETVTDFVNQFKTIAFLDRLAFEPLSNVMNFLETYANVYENYGSGATHLNGGSTHLALDFTAAGYDKTTLSSDHQEYAAAYMAGSYTDLDALNTKFAELLVNLASLQTPSTPTYTPPASTGTSTSVSVGLETPIVGEDANPFTDIDDVEWAREAIIALAKEGVIEGVSAKQYQPNANVTREQFVKIIVNTFGLKGTGVAASFEDVDQNEWYASYINTAVELGIIKGVSATAFGVGQNISRQDMTLIMYRVANYVGIDVSAKSGRTFTDADSIDSYAIDAVTALYRAEIVNGIAEGVFGGQQTATRAQAAKLCYDLRESK